MSYDESYNNIPNLFGTEPEKILKDYYHLLDKSSKVLDIGAGQGRHSIFLASNGITVDAIDPSGVAIDSIDKIASKDSLPINIFKSSFDDFNPTTDKYSGLLLFGLIQMLTREQIDLLLKNIDKWTGPGSLIWITAWGVHDPRYEERKSKFDLIGQNSLMSPDGSVYTYLKQDEILKLFEDYDSLHHWEGLGEWHRHGNSLPERHGRVEAVLQKP
jgi:cyclopropane fatty-acyl-phospholipid synthase-like methyltransferase